MNILYLSSTRLNYSLNAVYVKGLRKNKVSVDACYFTRGIGSYSKVLRYFWQRCKWADALMIGYDSSGLAILLRLFFRKKMIYNAVLPTYERLIVSRKLAGRRSLKALYYWLVDYLAYAVSDLVMLETDHQTEYVSAFYRISKRRLLRAWVGVDEENFFYEPTITKKPEFTVLFRGAFMPEAGVEYAVRAAKLLENTGIKFLILGNGIMLQPIQTLVDTLRPKNLTLKTEFLPYETLQSLMQQCHVSLGQLSDHERLQRTVPQKAYESLVMKLPYLTAENSGILELVMPDKTCFTCQPADAESLAEKIVWIKKNYAFAERVAENAYQFYQKELKPELLAASLLRVLRN